jgi:hypothetical protein
MGTNGTNKCRQEQKAEDGYEMDVAPCNPVDPDRRFEMIAVMMEAARTSETSVSVYQSTPRDIT